MSSRAELMLEETIRKSGEGWIIDSFAPKEDAMSHIQRTIENVDQLAMARWGESGPRLSEQVILDEFERNPTRVRGFFQVLGGFRTPAMLLMVWRIMQGLDIKEVQLSYHRKRDFHVRVVLVSARGEEDLPYESSEINDFAIFRHLGVLQIGNRPVFDGFYPLRLT